MSTDINGVKFKRDGEAFIATDTPSDVFPVGSECPLHLRTHNAHGWYVCLRDREAVSAFGPYLVTNNGEFNE